MPQEGQQVSGTRFSPRSSCSPAWLLPCHFPHLGPGGRWRWNLLKSLCDKVLMNNKRPMIQAVFLNLKVCTSILSNLEKQTLGLSGRICCGQSECQVPHRHGVWCGQPFWRRSLGDSHLAAEGHTPARGGVLGSRQGWSSSVKACSREWIQGTSVRRLKL